MKNLFTPLIECSQKLFLNYFVLWCCGIASSVPLSAFANLKPVKHAINNQAKSENYWVAGPVFATKQYNFTISDKSNLSNSVGKVQAITGDKNSFKYAITKGNTNKAFTVDPVTGTISVAKRLNYHTQGKYQLTVQVRDASNLTDTATVAITLIYEPSGDAEINKIAWSSAANQPYIFYEGQGKVVNNKWYTFSGFDALKGFTPTSRAYVYDPNMNTWSPTAAMPGMNGTNYGGITHAGFATDETDIYFAGGYTANRTGQGQILGTKEVWKYIVAENRYVRMPDLPRTSAAGQLEYLEGKLHYIAGTDRKLKIDLGDHYVLNLDNISAGWNTLAPLPSPRQHAGSAVYQGKIYFIAGQTGHDEGSVSTKLVHVYDPATDSWNRLADVPAPEGTPGIAHISSSVVIYGDQIIVLGGEYEFTKGTRRVSTYSPATNTWTNITGLPMIMRGGVGAVINGKLYYTGGKGVKATITGIPTSTQAVTQLTLVNAENGTDIRAINSGDIVNLAALPTRKINIRATTNPDTIGSVVFQLTGKQSRTQTESKLPYSLFGETWIRYNAWVPETGEYSLKVTPYAQSAGEGLAGSTLMANFTVIDSLVTNLKSTTAHRYAVTKLTLGTNIYTDRTYEAATIPEYLVNATLIQSPNDDKLNTGENIFSFDLNHQATVYVAYNSLGTTLPNWLSSWQKVPSQVVMNSPKNRNMVLYSKSFAPGKLSFGGNLALPAQGSQNNYFIIIKEETSPAGLVVNTANVDQPTKEFKKSPSINVYPNPNRLGEKLNIQLDKLGKKEEVLLTLYDITGHALLTQNLITDDQGNVKAQFSIKEVIKSGVYLIQVNAASGKQQVKLFVQ